MRLKEFSDFDIDRVLDKGQIKIVKLYFYPQKLDNRWLTQKDVLEKIKGSPIKKLRAALVSSLLQIWKLTR
ncbi:hypothetical protein IID22_00805 [Patescibacteria group bacterium]|nr:hypothetical protein [Patescibacteria group bacterium]